MLKRFLPREENFFKYFEEISAQLLQATKQFQLMLTDLNHVQTYAATISEIEQQSDTVAHITFELLHKTFITPFDRHDIHRLTGSLDDMLDHIDLSARYLAIYQLTSVPEPIHAIVNIAAHCAEFIQGALLQLKFLGNTEEILRLCQAINQADDEAQTLALNGIQQLFNEEQDIKRLLKIKKLYEGTSAMVERCQHIANIIRGIVLEYA